MEQGIGPEEIPNKPSEQGPQTPEQSRRELMRSLLSLGLVHFSMSIVGSKSRAAPTMMPVPPCGTALPAGNVMSDSACQTAVPGGYLQDHDCNGLFYGPPSLAVFSDETCNYLIASTGEVSRDNDCQKLMWGSGEHYFADNACGISFAPDIDCGWPDGSGNLHRDDVCGQLRSPSGSQVWWDSRCQNNEPGGYIYEDIDCGLPGPPGGPKQTDSDCGLPDDGSGTPYKDNG
jgi:hypothetical protein